MGAGAPGTTGATKALLLLLLLVLLVQPTSVSSAVLLLGAGNTQLALLLRLPALRWWQAANTGFPSASLPVAGKNRLCRTYPCFAVGSCAACCASVPLGEQPPPLLLLLALLLVLLLRVKEGRLPPMVLTPPALHARATAGGSMAPGAAAGVVNVVGGGSGCMPCCRWCLEVLWRCGLLCTLWGARGSTSSGEKALGQ
jgi:hypothetical protein